MTKSKHIDKICIAIISVTLVVTVLFMFGENLGITAIKSEEDENTTEMFTSNDLNSDWDTSDATTVTLSGDTAQISGNGAYFADNTVKIVYAGKYLLSGDFNGSINIDADGDDKIWIMLNGVNITSSTDSPISITKADKVFLTLAEKSENTLTFENTDENTETDGSIFSRDDLTVNGSGKLTVTSSGLHGIVCNDSLVFTGGEIDITAKTDGIHAHDAIKIRNTNITVSAGDDGLHAGNDDQTSKFYLESGNIKITECYEGIEANDITIVGGTVDIRPSDDGLNANGNGANSLITVSGGDITVINQNGRDADGFDSNGSINITGGNIFVSVVGSGTNSALDYGSENGGSCTISGGTVIACGSSSMAEGPDESSTQGFIMQTVSGSANDTLSLIDEDGVTILSKEIPCSFTSVVLSSPDIVLGDTLTLKIADNSEEITVDNSSSSGGFGGNMGGFGGNRGGFGGFSKDGNNSDETTDDSSLQLIPSDSDGNTTQKPDNFGDFSKGDFNPDDMPSDFDPSSMPSGGFSGKKPQEMPNGSDSSNEPPEMPNKDGQGNFSDGGDTNGNTDKNGFFGNGNGQTPDNQNEQNLDLSEDNTSSKKDSFNASEWIWIAISVLVLGVGLVIVIKKKY